MCPTCEGNSGSTNLKIKCTLWNLKVYYNLQSSSFSFPELNDSTITIL